MASTKEKIQTLLQYFLKCKCEMQTSHFGNVSTLSIPITVTVVCFLLHMLQIDAQSLFRCHVHAKLTTYIIAYKSPPMTI